MKKIWKYRFVALIIIGQILMWSNMDNAHSNFKLVLWGLGMIVCFVAVLLQIVIAPNYSKTNLKRPDCSADLKYEDDKLKFVKHNT
jgi:hypothetical protein